MHHNIAVSAMLLQQTAQREQAILRYIGHRQPDPKRRRELLFRRRKLPTVSDQEFRELILSAQLLDLSPEEIE